MCVIPSRCAWIFLFLVIPPSNGWTTELSQSYVNLIFAEQYPDVEKRFVELEHSKQKNADGIYLFYQTLRKVTKDLALDPEAALPILNKWCETYPGSYMAHLIRGRFYIYYAWGERGTGFVNTVLPEAVPVFHQRLNLARQDLTKATQFNPSSAEPWIAQLTIIKAKKERSKVMHRVQLSETFDKARELDKDHFGAYAVMLSASMAKWGGSNEIMLAFARMAYLEKHPHNPTFAFLLLEAHDEMAHQEKLAGNGSKQDYFRRKEVAEEIQALLKKTLEGLPGSTRARNWSAKLKYFAGKYTESMTEIELLGDAIDEDVWSRRFVMKIKGWMKKQRAKGKF